MKRISYAALFVLGSGLSLIVSQVIVNHTRHIPASLVRLDDFLPKSFGRWAETKVDFTVVDPSRDGSDRQSTLLYDQVTSRMYRREDGTEVVLTFAYRHVQEQESKIHRPELCYFAQGYALTDRRSVLIPSDRGPLSATTFQARQGGRFETVLYWIRIGDVVSPSAWSTRGHLFGLGLHGMRPDGLLVRASIVAPAALSAAEVAIARTTLTDFLVDAVNAVPPSRRWILIGGPAALTTMR